jgi:hypothetical protein
MAQGQMNGIHLCFIIFLDSLPINSTTLKFATYLEFALGNTTYHHQDGGIMNTEIALVLLNRGSRTYGRDPSMFLNFLDSLPINYTTLGNTKYYHQCSGIPNT